ncbi:MAG: hypothetical protein U5N58_01595 [Actinomycetota bacterium]|nr:hypothetical protein [Actinomycetota bacterium]
MEESENFIDEFIYDLSQHLIGVRKFTELNIESFKTELKKRKEKPLS